MKKDLFNIWDEISGKCMRQYGVTTGNNARFIGETIFNETKGKDFFAYAECGVYKGSTFFPIYHLCEILFKDFVLYALDSFSGFPEDSVLSKNDKFDKFEKLFKEDKITEDHLEKARERCGKLSMKEHLQKDYFGNYADEFLKKAEGKKEIMVVKGSFKDLKTNFTDGKDRYDLVFLDCDLYLSYKYCLDYFKDKTDIFIFDEYYSLKYPGARIACDEFVNENPEWKFFTKIESNPYFERWGIRKCI